MKHSITKESIESIHLSFTQKYQSIVERNNAVFYGEPGQRHYLFLSMIASSIIHLSPIPKMGIPFLFLS
jgi:hypothetical protein